MHLITFSSSHIDQRIGSPSATPGYGVAANVSCFLNTGALASPRLHPGMSLNPTINIARRPPIVSACDQERSHLGPCSFCA